MNDTIKIRKKKGKIPLLASEDSGKTKERKGLKSNRKGEESKNPTVGGKRRVINLVF